MCLVRVVAALEARPDAVEKADEVFDDDRHVISRLAVEFDDSGGLKNANAHCLWATLAISNRKLDACARANRDAVGQSGCVKKHFVAFIGCNEAEAFVVIVKLDLAGGHEELLGLDGAHPVYLPDTNRIYSGGMAQQRNPATTDSENLPVSRLERTLAFMVFSTIGLSILCFLAVIIGSTLGWAPWPVIIILPLVGLPIGFVLIIALIAINLVRRSRANRATQ